MEGSRRTGRQVHCRIKVHNRGRRGQGAVRGHGPPGAAAVRRRSLMLPDVPTTQFREERNGKGYTQGAQEPAPSDYLVASACLCARTMSLARLVLLWRVTTSPRLARGRGKSGGVLYWESSRRWGSRRRLA